MEPGDRPSGPLASAEAFALAVLLGACSRGPATAAPAVAPPPSFATPAAAPVAPAVSATAAPAAPMRAWEEARRGNAGGASCRTSAPNVIAAVEGALVTREPRIVVGREIALVLFTAADGSIVAVPLDADARGAGPAVRLPAVDTATTPPVAIGARAVVGLVDAGRSSNSILVLDAAGRTVGAPVDVTVPDRASRIRQLRASGASVLVLFEAANLPRVIRLAVGPGGAGAPQVLVDRPIGFERIFGGDEQDNLDAWLALDEDEQGVLVLSQLRSDQQGVATGLVFPPNRVVPLRGLPATASAVALRARAGTVLATFDVVGAGLRGLVLARDGSGARAPGTLAGPTPDDGVVGRWQPGRAEVHLARQDDSGRPLPDVTVARAHGTVQSGDVPYGGAAWDGQAFVVVYEDCSATGCRVLTVRAFCPAP